VFDNLNINQAADNSRSEQNNKDEN